MSKSTEDTITCKSCGWQQPFVAWDSLNVTIDRARKQELIDGDLTRFRCEKCGWSTEVVYPMLYHDMDKHLMLWLVPSGGEPLAGDLPFGRLMTGHRFRCVSTRNELVEKILIFDSALDDRVIECFKLVVEAQSKGSDHPLPGVLRFAGITQTATGQMIQFQHLDGDEREPVEFPIEGLNQVRDLLADRLQSTHAEKGKWLRVDAAYARTLFAEFPKGGGGRFEVGGF